MNVFIIPYEYIHSCDHCVALTMREPLHPLPYDNPFYTVDP